MERAESPYSPFPFLLGYAAAVLEEDGVEVEVIDACAERIDTDAFLDRVSAAQPDVVMAEISTPSFHGDMRTLQGVRDLGFDGPILVGGLHKPLYDPAFLSGDLPVDGTLVGEYEHTLRDFARAGGRPTEPIPGLVWRGADGVLDGGRKPSQEGLDAFPWPARHLFKMDAYHDLPGGIPSPSVQLWASRGCSFTCSFCAWPQILYGDHAYRVRDAGAVADEVLAMAEQGYRSVYFDDDTFNLGKKRTAAIAKAFKEREVHVPWAFMGRADTCDPAQYEDLVATGLQAVKYGVESADTARLKQIGKNLDVQRVRDSIRAVKSLGVKVHLTFMFGLPGETLDTMQRTLDLAYELDPDSAQFTVATPFPGSRLYSELRESGRLDGLEFEDLDGYRTGVVSTDALQAEQIISFVHGVHRRWEGRDRPAGLAPVIPVSEVGGSGVSVGLLVKKGEAAWLRDALRAVAGQEGPSREIVVAAEAGDPELELAAAEVCDWATFVDVEGGPLANAVAPRCAGNWIALLQAPAVPRDGWLEAVIDASRSHPDAGALALPASDGSLGRALSRSGRSGDGVQAPFAASSSGGVFSRALWEDLGGFDPDLPPDLADLELALRGVLMGYRTVAVAAPPLDRLPLSSDPRLWARGRVRLLLKALPRELWREAAPGIAIQTLLDVARLGPSAALGTLDGLREARETLGERRRALGRRRVGPGFVAAAFDESDALSPFGRPRGAAAP